MSNDYLRLIRREERLREQSEQPVNVDETTKDLIECRVTSLNLS